MLRNRPITLALVALAIIGALYLFFSSGTSPRDPGSVSCSPDIGERLSYSLKAETHVRYDPSVLLSSESSDSDFKVTKQDFKGNLSLLALEKGRSDTLLAAQFSDLTDQTGSQQMRDSLSRIFQFRLAADCTYSGFQFHPKVTQKEQALLVHLLQEYQVALPRTSTDSTWVRQEVDSIGSYVATYRLRGRHNTLHLRKEKSSYKTLAAHDPQGKMKANILLSRAEATFEKGSSWISGFTSRQGTELLFGGILFIKSEGSFELRALTSPVTSIDLWNLSGPLKGLVRFQPHQKEPTPSTNKRFVTTYPKKNVTGRSLKAILKEFEKLLSSSDPNERNRGLSLLVQYLRQETNGPDLLTASIKKGDISENHHSTLFLALQLADTTNANNALAKTLPDSGHTPMNRMRSAIAMQDLTNPTTDVIDSLLVQMKGRPAREANNPDEYHVSRTATLALGTLAKNSDSPETSSPIHKELVAALHGEQEVGETALYLEAIGNTKEASLSPDVAPYLSNDSPITRAAAASALGSLPDPSSQNLLTNQYRKERSPNVRLEIMTSLNKQAELSNDSVGMVQQSISKEKDPLVRNQMIRLLGPRAASNPDIIRTLAKTAKKETRRENILLIGKYLGSK